MTACFDDRLLGTPWRVEPWGDGSSPVGCANILSDTFELVIAADISKEIADAIVEAVNDRAAKDRAW